MGLEVLSYHVGHAPQTMQRLTGLTIGTWIHSLPASRND